MQYYKHGVDYATLWVQYPNYMAIVECHIVSIFGSKNWNKERRSKKKEISKTYKILKIKNGKKRSKKKGFYSLFFLITRTGMITIRYLIPF